MPTTIFDWIARTAMLAMAGLVTLSILGAIAAMTNDPGTRFSLPRDRPVIEGERAQEPEAQAPSAPEEEGNLASVAAPGQGQGVQSQGQGVAIAAAPPPPDDKVARWLEAIAYALLALVGIGILGILMLWSMVRELRRIERSR
jgi:hypothetical protein